MADNIKKDKDKVTAGWASNKEIIKVITKAPKQIKHPIKALATPTSLFSATAAPPNNNGKTIPIKAL